MAKLNFVITVLCPSCGEFTEVPLAHIEVLTDGDFLGSCKHCDVSIKCHLTPRAADEVTTCSQCGHNEFWGGRCHVVGCGSPLRR